MEFKCKYYEIDGFGFACKVEKIVKNSSVPCSLFVADQNSQGKLNADIKLFEIDQPLEVFPRSLHEKFPNLTHLWISGCDLKKISNADLVGLEKLEILDLDRNDLTSLPDNLFAGMKKLMRVYIKNNKLERLSSKLLKPVEKSLGYADFEENTKIDDYFDKNDPNRSLTRLMDIMDSLEPPLPETDPSTQN